MRGGSRLGWNGSMPASRLYALAQGGTAVGTGLNAPKGFADFC